MLHADAAPSAFFWIEEGTIRVQGFPEACRLLLPDMMIF